ncbi:hypothetical protein ZOSMA_32G00360 [Zostera marina]|uniref:Uncharacterized protein n=1 Tax=Zostera marina TaxID=29655 RepID=A0A0K9PAI8_ZOSMR|nr:hypothetical protein ZOSMA_32G00360 [Zostera marina]
MFGQRKLPLNLTVKISKIQS